MLQKEVAERVAAGPGGKDYGPGDPRRAGRPGDATTGPPAGRVQAGAGGRVGRGSPRVPGAIRAGRGPSTLLPLVRASSRSGARCSRTPPARWPRRMDAGACSRLPAGRTRRPKRSRSRSCSISRRFSAPPGRAAGHLNVLIQLLPVL
jgi:hypothetical protein